MSNVAIISEYNPFHNGHSYQISKTRELLGEDTNVICIMSGNFVQRGDFAIFDKHTRAKMAVLSGADLVIELPLPYALSSAENFAKGSISLINQLNVINHLSFGSECGNIDELCEIAQILLEQTFLQKVKENLKSGVSYPKALDLTLGEINPKYSEIIKNPNNTLGIEYIKSLILTKSDVLPLTILRKNVEHHSEDENDGFASASYIRQNINGDILHLIPEKSAEQIENMEHHSIFDAENSILSFLKRKDADYFAKIADVSEGLEYKIVSSLKSATSLTDLYEKIKSKRYTQSRIRRIILNAYLEITSDYQKISPKYAKVLAFNDNGRKVLKQISEKSSVPAIIKPSADYNLDEDGKKLLALDNLATDLYMMCAKEKEMRVSSLELLKSPIYVGEK